MLRLRPKYLVPDLDRHGNLRVYVRKPGQPKHRIRSDFDTPQFWREYADALEGRAGRNSRPHPLRLVHQAPSPADDSLNALCEKYYRNPAFTALAPSTRAARRRGVEALCDAAGRDGWRCSIKPAGALDAAMLRAVLDGKGAKPHAANAMLKAWRGLFRFAIETKELTADPTAGVKRLKTKAGGHHSWTQEEVSQYAQRWPVGTKQYLALALLLCTAQRKSDVVRMGTSNIKNGWMILTQKKNDENRPVTLAIPIAPQLSEAIATCNHKSETFLQTEYGKPFTAAGFGMRFREWCDQAGLPHCSAHGLRKAAAALMAEAGCSERQIMSVTGHAHPSDVTVYVAAARQRVMAAETIKRVWHMTTIGSRTTTGLLPMPAGENLHLDSSISGIHDYGLPGHGPKDRPE